MMTTTPVLDSRTSEDIYSQALKLAKRYCPELNLPDDTGYFDKDDPGLVILKLFSKSTEYLITQLNRVPEKQYLAFLDFMGIDLLPARPSRVPLTFYCAEGSSGAYVPPFTQVASSEDPDIIFETTEGLSVVPAELSAVFSLNPWDDTYTDHTPVAHGDEGGFRLFGKDGHEKSPDHILYLGDDTLFDLNRPPAEFAIHIEGTHLHEQYFSRWYAGNTIPKEHRDIRTSQDAAKLDIIFDVRSIQKLERSSVNGTESFWLSVSPEKKIIKVDALPMISRISADIGMEGLFPDAVIFNTNPLDIAKGFYPFGEEPKKGDTLYIGSDEVFSKAGANIRFDIEPETPLEKGAVSLKWEYWNGSGWDSLLNVTDTTEAFTKSGQVMIEMCPSLPVIEINGQANRWIRVRIVSEQAYGTAGSFQPRQVSDVAGFLSKKLKKSEKKTRKALEGVTLGFEYKPPSYTPPFLQSLKIAYSYTDRKLQRLRALNNFQYKDLDVTLQPKPYKVPEDEMPALYLGYKKNIARMPAALFFAVKERLFGEEQISIKNPVYGENAADEATGLAWHYWTGVFWEQLRVEDETDSLKKSGIVHFSVPPDAASTSKFGMDLFWIRVEVKDGMWVPCPKLQGIFQNTVWALNSVTYKDEVLGSGNGEPNRTLTFSNRPLLEGQVIEIKEPVVPSHDELKTIESREGRETLRIIEEAGEIKEVWVRWRQVKNFSLSGPTGRHYLLDRAQGTVTFGDGVRGMIPPAGMHNIVARHYRSGGGARGDVAPKTVVSLRKTIPYIDRVINHSAASGGMDQEIVEHAAIRGPHTIQSRNRAVTSKDFAWLAQEASLYVARAKCIVHNGRIKVIIAPKYEGDAPLPDAGLLDSVARYLKDRAFLAVLDRIDVVGPKYTPINVRVNVRPVSFQESSAVSDRIHEKLTMFLHPLTGGVTGDGWDFGQALAISQIAALIEDIEGVDYVQEIEVEKVEPESTEEASGVQQIAIEPDALPCAGVISVEMEG